MFHQRPHFSWPSWPNFFRRSLLLSLAMLGAVLLKNGFSYNSTATLLKAALLFGFLSGICYTLILTTEIKLFVNRISFFHRAVLQIGPLNYNEFFFVPITLARACLIPVEFFFIKVGPKREIALIAHVITLMSTPAQNAVEKRSI